MEWVQWVRLIHTSFGGAVVPRIAIFVLKEQGAKEGWDAQDTSAREAEERSTLAGPSLSSYISQ